jgi:hypothetical protein
MSPRVDFEAPEDRHWFAIDRAILASRGKPLFGPPAPELFVPAPRALLLEVVAEAVGWSRRSDARSSDTVLNACRALRYAEEESGRRSSPRAPGQ